MSIKKLLIAVLLLNFSLITLTGCRDNQTGLFGTKAELMSQPSLKVIYKEKSIEAIRGSFSWATKNKAGTIKVTDTCTSGPRDLVKEALPLNVPSSASLQLNFNHKPDSMTVNIWQGDEIIKQEVADSKVIVPELKGPAIYEVVADWSQGTVSYAFIVNVD